MDPKKYSTTVNWLKGNVEAEDGGLVMKQNLHDIYSEYCANINMVPRTSSVFGKLIRKVFVGVETTKRGTWKNYQWKYVGINQCNQWISSISFPIHPFNIRLEDK